MPKAKAGRQWLPRVYLYVSELPGQGGADWGYTKRADKALPLSFYWQRRFAADCRRAGVKPNFYVQGEG